MTGPVVSKEAILTAAIQRVSRLYYSASSLGDGHQKAHRELDRLYDVVRLDETGVGHDTAQRVERVRMHIMRGGLP